ncbi:MAG TPA: hypothetical protein VMV86_04545 [Methanosarcinales archaeon]|nr:hypothetical protein [Methanosarcinales archaeon]
MKIIKIDSCSNCPHLVYVIKDVDVLRVRCEIMERDWDYKGVIPDWCSLDNL